MIKPSESERRAARSYLEHIEDAAQKFNIPVPVLLGIGSRESQWGLALDPPDPSGTGDFIRRNGELAPDGRGWGRGLMQIDWNAHEFARTGDWQDPRKNIMYGARVLRNAHDYVSSHFDVEALSGASLSAYHASISAYNTGAGNVSRSLRLGRSPDWTTHMRNYSESVLDRARGFLATCGWVTDWNDTPEWDTEQVDPIPLEDLATPSIESLVPDQLDDLDV